MGKFREKSKVVEAITFDELVEHGRQNGANIVDGMPWCWKYKGHGVTHENDRHYLIVGNNDVLNMHPNHLLVTYERDGQLHITVLHSKDIEERYEEVGEISDGYHTFNELYIHRHALFINVINAHQDKSFKTHRNDAGEQWEGWFIAGLNTRFGQITYHLPIAYWDSVNAIEVDSNSDYDGHSAADVAERLLLLAGD